MSEPRARLFAFLQLSLEFVESDTFPSAWLSITGTGMQHVDPSDMKEARTDHKTSCNEWYVAPPTNLHFLVVVCIC